MTVHVQTWAVTPAGWPKAARLRIVMIADLHACRPWMPERRVSAIVDQAQALGGDMIALLGDYPAHIPMTPDLSPSCVAAQLARLTAPLGVWSESSSTNKGACK